MNLLLVEPHEIESGTARLGGRRAEHVARVLRKKIGDALKIGVVGRGRATATIVEIEERAGSHELVCAFDPGALALDPLPRLHLAVALPRPKALSRLIQTASSLGLRSLDLIDAYRVEKTYFDSARLAAERIAEDVWLGAEQGAQVHFPDVTVTRGFSRYLNEILPLGPVARNAVLHPGAARTFHDFPETGEDDRLVIGPEGGFTEGELGAFSNHGFETFSLGAPVLRTEAAVVAAWAEWSITRIPRTPAASP